VNSEHSVFLRRQDLDVRHAVLIDFDALAGTPIVLQIAGDHVAVSARLQAREESLLQIELVAIDGDEGGASAAEGDLVLTVVPPGIQDGLIRNVPEADHVVDLAPSVLADPAVAAGVVGIDDRRQDVVVGVLRRTRVEVVKIEGAHDTWTPVGMRQHESDSHLPTRSL